MTLREREWRDAGMLRQTESVWRDATSGGYVAEVRGLYDQARGYHEWVRLGVYGTREAAVAAVLAARK